MTRFAAKLLFRFRPPNGGKKPSRFFCEERIVTFTAPSATRALAKAKRLARKGAHSFQALGGGRVHFEPVGVMELMELGVETGPDRSGGIFTSASYQGGGASWFLPNAVCGSLQMVARNLNGSRGAAGARRLRNESFFSAPQLKRDPLGGYLRSVTL